MGLIDDAIARKMDTHTGRRIDYERMSREHPKQKAALTRAIKTDDSEVIAQVCKAAIKSWDECGAWPDDWHRWQAALDATLPWTQHIDLRDL